MVIDDGRDPGAYDADVPLLLHEWEPSLRRQAGVDVEFKAYSINGRMLGAGEPVRVKEGSRVLFRMVNASATLTHQLACPGTAFAPWLDGTRARPAPVPIVELAPGERVDAVVEMNRPGV
jgi:hypothetical protein